MRREALVLALALPAFGLSSGGGCSSDPYCGDGVVNVQGELCDDGNSDDTDFCLSTCQPRPIPRLTVKWSFNEDEMRGFTGDSCTDMGARDVQVALRGPTELTSSDQCSYRQASFSDLPSGTYDVSIDVLDAGGEVIAVAEEQVEFGGGEEESRVVVPFDAWSDDYNGSYFFRLTWAGADCDGALVTTQRLTFTRPGGESVASVTKVGDSLTGGDSPCRPLSEVEPQTVLDVPFGPATLTVQGLDDLGEVIYESSFKTFIGAGLNNPEQALDVAVLPPT